MLLEIWPTTAAHTKRNKEKCRDSLFTKEKSQLKQKIPHPQLLNVACKANSETDIFIRV